MIVKNMLHLYDADDAQTRILAGPREADESVGVKGGADGLIKVLDKFVSEGWIFQRAVVSTHGNSGFIALGEDHIDAAVLDKRFSGKRYATLFSYNARIYFVGCNVAEGNKGWKFLETAGTIFLGRYGGTTFAHTGAGRPLAHWYAFAALGPAGQLLNWNLPGRTHFTSPAKYVYTAPGGRMFSRSPCRDDWDSSSVGKGVARIRREP
jgi:hypothetical protein